MSMSFDFSAVNALAADLGEVKKEVIPNVRKAVEVTARHIDDDWTDAAKAQNPQHARAYPRSVTYDMELDRDGSISAQIGPDLSRPQGTLGILEEAPGGVRSEPQGNARKALRKNLADFERGILKATEGAL